jgi:hypothetical protein
VSGCDEGERGKREAEEEEEKRKGERLKENEMTLRERKE